MSVITDKHRFFSEQEVTVQALRENPQPLLTIILHNPHLHGHTRHLLLPSPRWRISGCRREDMFDSRRSFLDFNCTLGFVLPFVNCNLRQLIRFSLFPQGQFVSPFSAIDLDMFPQRDSNAIPPKLLLRCHRSSTLLKVRCRLPSA
jgi:hypothetical protein